MDSRKWMQGKKTDDKATKQTDKEMLEEAFGSDVAERIISQAQDWGRSLRGIGVRFKSRPDDNNTNKADGPPFEDDEEDNDEKEDMEDDEDKSLVFLLAGAIKSIMDDQQLETLKTLQEYGNQMALMRISIDEYKTKTDRIYMELFGSETRSQKASRSGKTIIDDNDPQTNFLQQKGDEGGEAFVPVFNRMQQMGFGGNLSVNDIPTSQNGGNNNG